MYKNFLYKIAEIDESSSNVVSFVGSLSDLDLDDKIQELILSGEVITQPEILEKISKNIRAVLHYIFYGNTKARVDSLKKVNFDPISAFNSDWRFGIFYLVYDLRGNINEDKAFYDSFIAEQNAAAIVTLVSLLKQANPSYAPDGKVEEAILPKISITNSTIERSELKPFRNYVALAAMYKFKIYSVELQKAIEIYAKYLKNKTNTITENTETVEPNKNISGLEKAEAVDAEVVGQTENTVSKKFIDKINSLTSDALNGPNTKLKDIVSSILDNDILKDQIKDFLKDNYKRDIKLKLEDENVILDNGISIPNLISELSTKLIQARSLRMYKSRIVKAYTNYYIKTYLPGLIKKAADNLPQVVTVGIGEVQDIMVNDGKLMEYDNPSVVNQISNDLTEAVNKPDLIPGGAADGMSIEDIARKWAPIYNMDYARILDILKKQLEFGKLVELEHTNNNDMAEEIAKDHLTEAADYYSYLEEMEQLFPSHNVAVKPAQEENTNFEPEFLENPDKQEEHTCKGDGSCGGACHCNHDIKPQTVEDKIKSLNQLADEGGSIIVTVISDAEPTQEETFSNSIDAADDYIMNVAAKIKR